ncbi:MAG: hypothetical protein ACAI44_01460, partial [Candidatus Sericytochromatia bacterium]
MAILWPETFRVQAIPDGTQSITVRISGAGLDTALERTLSRNSGAPQTLDLELPVGAKQVEVKALSDKGLSLAEDRQQVEIRPNQTTRLEMDLEP